MQNSAIHKKEKLTYILKELESMVVAFSGGVDSTFLLALAHETLGDKVVAATASSVIHPDHEINDSRSFTREREIRHIVFNSREMNVSDFVCNNPDRCYHCKMIISRDLFQIAEAEGLKHVAHGANTDDLSDFRPGLKAAHEAGIIAPLIDAQLTKNEIRFLSREMELPTWNKPSKACLATRIPYGTHITKEKLEMIEEAENFLLEQGFTDVRVRHHGSIARVEIGNDELEKLVEKRLKTVIVNKLRKIGFAHIAVDLEGYISGKMNRTLENNQ